MMLAHFTVSLILFATAVAIGIIVISSKMKVKLKLAVVLLLMISGTMTYRALNDVYGYPIIMQKNFEDALIIGHLLDKENKVIHIWLKSDGDMVPRSYTIPFKNNTAKFLERMRMKHRGKPYRVGINNTVNKLSRLNNSVEETEFHEIIVLPPKHIGR